MKVLVTGGAGFIGRWIVKKLLEKGIKVYVVDDLSNGQKENLKEFENDKNFKQFLIGDTADKKMITSLFENKFDICIHSAAQINVQESLDNPQKSFDVNILGTFNILEAAKKHVTKIVLISTCMVYDIASNKAIDEKHSIKPASPYAASKLAAEELAISYYYGYKLPVLIIRPFNTYGPFQKRDMEGGVVSIFIKRELNKETLNIFGDGTQTRDLLYVEDCANFIVQAALSDKFNAEIFNIGLGKDITINELAALICKDQSRIKHISHHHPQSEIHKLLCDCSKAKKIFNWQPSTSLKEGITTTKKWLINNN